MRMNQESRCPSEYYSSNLYRKRYPRKTRCIIKSGNIFCSRMRHVRMQNGPRTSVSVSGKWSCIFCESHSQIIAFFGLLKYFQTCILTFCILYVFSLFSFTEKKYHDVISFHVFARWNFIALLRFVYHLHLENWKRNIYLENKSLLKN